MKAYAALAVVLTVPACGAASEGETTRGFEGAPFSTVTTSPRGLELAIRFTPEAAPIRGVNGMELQITDSVGRPREGLDVTLVPWMPAMNHGSSVQPSISVVARGRYLADNVTMFMPGRWQLRITVADPDTTDLDHGTVDLDVP